MNKKEVGELPSPNTKKPEFEEKTMKKTIEVEVCDVCKENEPDWECEICGKKMCDDHYDNYDEPHWTFPESVFCKKCYNKVWKRFQKLKKKLYKEKS